MELGQLALIRSRDLARFGRIQTIRRAGARVGYQRGTTGERFVAEGLPRATSFASQSLDFVVADAIGDFGYAVDQGYGMEIGAGVPIAADGHMRMRFDGGFSI